MSKDLFVQLPQDLQNALATKAGLMLSTFNPNGPFEASTIQKSILFATSGGVNTSCVFTFKDHADGIDNCPKNTKELLDVQSVACSMSGTAVTITEESAVAMIGLADKAGDDVITVTPRMDIKPEDFKTLWYVCPYGTQGGFIAIELKDALSMGGFTSQSADEDNSRFTFNFKGYSSLAAPDVVPFKFYLKKSGAAAAKVLNIQPNEEVNAE